MHARMKNSSAPRRLRESNASRMPCKDPKRDLVVDLIRRIGNELYYSATIWWVVVGDDSMTQGVEVSK